MASPSRLQMPLIHPEKENNGLWFKIDKCLTDDCNMVADEMKFTWWGDFVVRVLCCPPYKGRVYGLGSAHCYYGDSTPSTSTANSHIHKPWQNRRIRHGQPRPPL
ncbi:unnamed protein product [Brassica rapa subsp. narinosa]|uniref:(rape) hypothetical protein n=1 Tax=Brassica napus TaxID=3708 RepID=A0A816YKW4_BRANA|nr:unnamed protein product [Brassica napus]